MSTVPQADGDDGTVPELLSREQDAAIAELQQKVSELEEGIWDIRKFLDRDLPKGISRGWTITTSDTRPDR